jgi:hypothetical protein
MGLKMMKPLLNDKYIGHECILCFKKIDEDERQSIVSLGCVQTWCVLCLIKKYPEDKLLLDFANKRSDQVIDRNKLFK